MPRCLGKANPRKGNNGLSDEAFAEEALVDQGLVQFWHRLSLQKRRDVLSVNRKGLFTRIREQFCSRCFGLFQLRYEEIKGAAELECAACLAFYAGLQVGENGDLTAEESIIESSPFTLFAAGKLRERERELQFINGDICGSGYVKRNGINMCALHSSPVPVEALIQFYKELPEDQRMAIFTLREDDFSAELDAHLKYQLRICKDCRINVMRAYRDVKHPRAGFKEGCPLDVCADVSLHVADRLAMLHGEDPDDFFHQAEAVEAHKTFDPDSELDSRGDVRHAETPDAAREALVDSTLLIFKGQVEIAFREQTAGHNALLLFVSLTARIMEEQLMNAYNDITAKERGAELLDILDKEKEKEASKQKKRQKKAGRLSVEVQEESQSASYRPCPSKSSSSKNDSRPNGASIDPPTSAPHKSPAARSANGSRDRTGEASSSRGPLPEDPGIEEEDGWEVQSTRRRSMTGNRKNGQHKLSIPESRALSPDQLKIKPPPPPPPVPSSHVKPEVSYCDVSRPRSSGGSGQATPYMYKGVLIHPPPPPPPREAKVHKPKLLSVPPEDAASRPNSWKIGTGNPLLNVNCGPSKADPVAAVSSWNPFGFWGSRGGAQLGDQFEELRIDASRIGASPRGANGICSPQTVDSEELSSQTPSQCDFSLFSTNVPQIEKQQEPAADTEIRPWSIWSNPLGPNPSILSPNSSMLSTETPFTN